MKRAKLMGMEVCGKNGRCLRENPENERSTLIIKPFCVGDRRSRRNSPPKNPIIPDSPDKRSSFLSFPRKRAVKGKRNDASAPSLLLFSFFQPTGGWVMPWIIHRGTQFSLARKMGTEAFWVWGFRVPPIEQ